MAAMRGWHSRLSLSERGKLVFFFTSLSVTYCTNLVTYPNPGTSPSPIDASPRLQTAPYTYAWHYDPCNAENLVWLAWAGDRTKSHRLEKEVRSQICRNEGALGVFHIFADVSR